jgi:hypothetical protein
MEDDWIRPTSSIDGRAEMLRAEKRRDYESAALHAIAQSDLSGQSPEDAASYERQAIAYAMLHQAQTALFIAEHRQPTNYGPIS